MYKGFIYCITNNINGKKHIGQTTMTVNKRWSSHKTGSKKYDYPLYRAMRKYGIDNFTVETKFSLSSTNIDELKQSLNCCERYLIGKYKTLANENGYNVTRGGDAGSIFYTNKVCQYDLKLNLVQVYNDIKEASAKTGVPEKTIRSNCEKSQQTGGGYVWCYLDNQPQKPKYKYDYDIDNVDISKYEPERLQKLMAMGWNGKRVVQYSVFGEILNIYNDPLDAAENLGFSSRLIYMYIGGGTRFKMTILLYEGDKFAPSDKAIKPIYMFDVNGNFVKRFSCSADADNYLGDKRGTVIQSVINHYLHKGYYFSYENKFDIKPKSKFSGISLEMLDDLGNVIRNFNSLSEAQRFLNIKNDKKMKKSIGNHIKYEGYYWRYKDESYSA